MPADLFRTLPGRFAILLALTLPFAGPAFAQAPSEVSLQTGSPGRMAGTAGTEWPDPSKPIIHAATAPPTASRGIYVTLILDDVILSACNTALSMKCTPDQPASPYPGTAAQNAEVDALLVSYFTTLLNNPAVSGLAPQAGWSTFSLSNPGPNPSSPLPGSYFWNPLIDVFTAVANWSAANPNYPPKTVQLLISSGNHSPAWVFSDIYNNSCGSDAQASDGAQCNGSCDGLFRVIPTDPPASRNCGYTTLFWDVESNTAAPSQKPLPMPWNNIYQQDLTLFLTTLRGQIATWPAPEAFIMIATSGPTASSTEMILPNTGDQKFTGNFVECTSEGCTGCEQTAANRKTCVAANGILALPGAIPTKPNIYTNDAWNILLQNKYGSDSAYVNNDGAFVTAWDQFIGIYGQIFNNNTISLTTTTDALPDFPGNTDKTYREPAVGFSSDCDDPSDPKKAMQCAAVTRVISYFVNPSNGGNSARAVFEAGMTAQRDGSDLGTNGIKWLSATTAGGKTPLPGTDLDMLQVTGGLQFAHSFSSPNSMQSEGCPTDPPTMCTKPPLTPSIAAENVFSDSFFPGTPAAPYFDASTTFDMYNFDYSNAPMNFVQIYDTDILYAEGLGYCPFQSITGGATDVSGCISKLTPSEYEDAVRAQAVLDVASMATNVIAEPSGKYPPPY